MYLLHTSFLILSFSLLLLHIVFFLPPSYPFSYPTLHISFFTFPSSYLHVRISLFLSPSSYLFLHDYITHHLNISVNAILYIFIFFIFLSIPMSLVTYLYLFYKTPESLFTSTPFYECLCLSVCVCLSFVFGHLSCHVDSLFCSDLFSFFSDVFLSHIRDPLHSLLSTSIARDPPFSALRQTEKQTEIQTERQVDTRTNKHTERHRKTDRHTERHAATRTNK